MPRCLPRRRAYHKFRIDTFASRGPYKLCVKPPKEPRQRRTFKLLHKSGGIYGSKIDFARNSSPRGENGRYAVSWHQEGFHIGPKLHFSKGAGRPTPPTRYRSPPGRRLKTTESRCLPLKGMFERRPLSLSCEAAALCYASGRLVVGAAGALPAWRCRDPRTPMLREAGLRVLRCRDPEPQASARVHRSHLLVKVHAVKRGAAKNRAMGIGVHAAQVQRLAAQSSLELLLLRTGAPPRRCRGLCSATKTAVRSHLQTP